MGYNTELQPYVPTDYIGAVHEGSYPDCVDHYETAYGKLPKLPMYYKLAKYEDTLLLKKKAKVFQLISTFVDYTKAEEIVTMLTPLLKESAEGYLQNVVQQLPSIEEEKGLS